MDTFVESSWYFDRYCCPDYDTKPGLDRKKLDYWMPVDQYIGGIEHAILHLLYSRFYTKVLRDFGVIGVDEPFTNLLTQGMVCKETMRCKEHGYLFPEQAVDGKCHICGKAVIIGKTEKMSKSLKNVVDPDYLVKKYGADTLRIFCLFAAPPEKDLEWSDQGVDGAFRFLGRLWRIADEYLEDIKGVAPANGALQLEGDLKSLRRKTHQTIRKVSCDFEDRFHFNTAIGDADLYFFLKSSTLHIHIHACIDGHNTGICFIFYYTMIDHFIDRCIICHYKTFKSPFFPENIC